ncbi:MAG: hypothetical protein O3C51_02850 [Planctomycetota bacterium]|nr:hypothetical protein [Planctomycetota bacterium]
MSLSPRTRRLIAYPLAVGVAASVAWFGFREVVPDVPTLVGAASVRAGMAQQIDPASPDGARLRAELLAEAEELASRAAAQEPASALVLETRAFLALVSGDAGEAARLYGLARGASDCEPLHHDLLALHEAKAWSNAGEVDRALAVLESTSPPDSELIALDRESLRVRLLSRGSRARDAVDAAIALSDQPWTGSAEAAFQLLEAMGALDAAASVLPKSPWRRALQDYFLARLKLRSGDTDTAGSLLERSLATGDQEVERRFRRDRDLWVAGDESGRFEQLMTPRAELATPPGAR